MLDMMSADVAHCYERARGCAEQARQARDKVIKADFLDLQARWLLLAQLYQFDKRPLVIECGREANKRDAAA